jgi:hypothetical protein
MSSQLTREDLKGMSAEAIAQARQEGRLRALLVPPEATVDEILDVTAQEAQAAAPASEGPANQPASDGQISREALAGMRPDAIATATREGRLNAVLGRPMRSQEAGQLTRADLAAMTPAAISQAKAEGRLDHLLGRNT